MKRSSEVDANSTGENHFMEQLSCTVSVKRHTGRFTFRIGGFPALDDSLGDSIESPEFELCGRRWQLRIFPGGSLQPHVGYISYYLASKSSVQTRASYKLMIVNQIQNGEDEIFCSSGIRKFEAKGESVDGWGRDKFCERTTLLNPRNGLCVQDTVIFRVEVTVYADSSPSKAALLGLDTRSIIDDLSFALAHESFADLTLVVSSSSKDNYMTRGSETEFSSPRSAPENEQQCIDAQDPRRDDTRDGKAPVVKGNCWDERDYWEESTQSSVNVDNRLEHREFRVSSFLLASRSPVFAAMLGSGMREDHTKSVIIDDCDPAVFEELLRYVYTDRCRDTGALQASPHKLLAAATKYDVRGLVVRCEEVLCSALTMDNVTETLILADHFDATTLKTFTISYMVEHAHEILIRGLVSELPKSLRDQVIDSIATTSEVKNMKTFEECDLKRNHSCIVL